MGNAIRSATCCVRTATVALAIVACGCCDAAGVDDGGYAAPAIESCVLMSAGMAPEIRAMHSPSTGRVSCLAMQTGKCATSLVDSLCGLALALDSHGQHAEAEVMFRKALVLCDSTNGGDSFKCVVILERLALTYHAQQLWPVAEPLLRCAVSSVMAQPDTCQGMLSSLLSNLAVNLACQREFEAADSVCVDAVRSAEASFGRTSQEVAFTLVNLATIKRSMGCPDSIVVPIQSRANAILSRLGTLD
jgi:hypothetical protein